MISPNGVIAFAEAASGLFTAFSAAMAAGASVIGEWHAWSNTKKLQSIHLDLNGRLTQLLIETRDASFSRGVANERQRDDPHP
jgi:hypothetical protein